jgi:hypothetical protein
MIQEKISFSLQKNARFITSRFKGLVTPCSIVSIVTSTMIMGLRRAASIAVVVVITRRVMMPVTVIMLPAMVTPVHAAVLQVMAVFIALMRPISGNVITYCQTMPVVTGVIINNADSCLRRSTQQQRTCNCDCFHATLSFF